MILIIIVVLIYIISARGTFLFLQNAHFHPKGKWLNVKPKDSDTFMVFFPFVNTILAFGYVFRLWKKDKTTNFFNLKQ